jgi:hypothetical protein
MGRSGVDGLRQALQKNSLAVLIVTFLCLLQPNASARVTAGNISGTVRNPTEGVVPDAFNLDFTRAYTAVDVLSAHTSVPDRLVTTIGACGYLNRYLRRGCEE